MVWKLLLSVETGHFAVKWLNLDKAWHVPNFRPAGTVALNGVSAFFFGESKEWKIVCGGLKQECEISSRFCKF